MVCASSVSSDSEVNISREEGREGWGTGLYTHTVHIYVCKVVSEFLVPSAQCILRSTTQFKYWNGGVSREFQCRIPSETPPFQHCDHVIGPLCATLQTLTREYNVSKIGEEEDKQTSHVCHLFKLAVQCGYGKRPFLYTAGNSEQCLPLSIQHKILLGIYCEVHFTMMCYLTYLVIFKGTTSAW